MRLRITKIDEYQFLSCLKHSLWGSSTARFRDWQKGDLLVFIVDKALAGYAEVSGESFRSDEIVWDDGLFPFRISMKFRHILNKNQRIPILGEIRDILISEWGNRYGWGILNQQLLTGSPAQRIITILEERPNNLTQTEQNIEQLLQEAKQQRDSSSAKKKQTKPPLKRVTETTLERVMPDDEEDSMHSQAQNDLIKLGRITGCSVWIASNDRNRSFHGKTLGDDCLKQLPNLGLND